MSGRILTWKGNLLVPAAVRWRRESKMVEVRSGFFRFGGWEWEYQDEWYVEAYVGEDRIPLLKGIKSELEARAVVREVTRAWSEGLIYSFEEPSEISSWQSKHIRYHGVSGST